MLLRIFKTSQPISWILIVFILLISRAVLFFVFNDKLSLYLESNSSKDLLSSFNANYALTSHFISSLWLIGLGFYFNRAGQQINFLKGINYLMFLFLGLFLSLDLSNLVLSTGLLSLPFLIFAYESILTAGQTKTALSRSFNNGFAIGIASLIYPPSITFLVLQLFSINYLHQSTWRNYLVAIIGFSTTILFTDVIIYVFFENHLLVFENWMVQFGEFGIHRENFSVAFIILLALLIWLSIVFLKTAASSIIRIRKALILNFILLVITGCSVVLYSQQTDLTIMAIPLAVLWSVFYLETKRWWVEDLAFLFLLSLFIFQ